MAIIDNKNVLSIKTKDKKTKLERPPSMKNTGRTIEPPPECGATFT